MCLDSTLSALLKLVKQKIFLKYRLTFVASHVQFKGYCVIPLDDHNPQELSVRGLRYSTGASSTEIGAVPNYMLMACIIQKYIRA